MLKLPLDLTLPLPLFEPNTECRSNADVEYAFVGEPPIWATLNEGNREVQILTEDPKLLGRNIRIPLKASVDDFEKEFSFTLFFPSKTETV